MLIASQDGKTIINYDNVEAIENDDYTIYAHLKSGKRIQLGYNIDTKKVENAISELIDAIIKVEIYKISPPSYLSFELNDEDFIFYTGNYI